MTPLRARAGRQGKLLDSQVVWILGSPRSGSTWLLAMLGEHERVVSIDEPLIGWYLGPFVSDVPGVDPSGIESDKCTFPRLQRSKRSQFFADEFKDVWLPDVRRLILDRFGAEAERYGGSSSPGRRLVVVKEPNGAQAADLLLQALPGSRLIFLLRDGRDVVDSHLAAIQPGSWAGQETGGADRGISEAERLAAVADAAHKWLWRTEIVEAAYRAHQGPKRLVRYEELLADPLPELRSLLDWLALDTPAADLQANVERNAFERLPEESKGPLRFFRAARPGLWRENLSGEEQRCLEAIIGEKLTELGYEPG
jgi:LPS sulfotransferase NodH